MVYSTEYGKFQTDHPSNDTSISYSNYGFEWKPSLGYKIAGGEGFA